MNLSDLGLGLDKPSFLPPDADSASVLQALQNRFGATKYNQQSVSRYPYYYYQAYPLAGTGSLPFFGTNQAQSSTALTNIETANTLGNYSMMITSISFDVFLYIPTVANNAPWSYSGTTGDATAPYADIVHGLTQGGYSQLTINNTVWDEVDLPFQMSPASIGKNRMELGAGMFSFSQAGGSPFAVTGTQASLCYADIERRAWKRRNLTNPIFIAPQTTFDLSIFYDFGQIPVIASTTVTSGSFVAGSPSIMVGAIFDGLRFAPLS
jgi:hypothetical protein